MAHCPSCGAETAPEDVYCTECGTDLTDSGATDAGGTDRSDAGGPSRSGGGQRTERASPRRTAGRDDPSVGARSAEQSGFTTGQKVGFAGVATTVIGAFLPWLTVSILGSTATKNGIDGDGSITLVLSLIAGAVLYAKYEGNYRWVSTAIGVIVALLALMYINDPLAGTGAPRGLESNVNVGIGLYLTALGGALIAGGPVYDQTEGG